MATQRVPTISEQDYLALERAAQHKSEFADGIMYAMAGGSLRHSSLAINLGAELRRQLKGRCIVYNSDAKVRAPTTRSYFYPDISVVCGEPETHESSDDILTNPSLIVEVLSPSTFNYDHVQKFAFYREIPSLQEYLLVHTDTAFIEQYSRGPENTWLLREHKGSEAVISLSMDCSLSLAEIYAT